MLRSVPRIERLRDVLMLLTDVGFVAYWAITALHLLPAAWLFKGYEQPLLQSWNWSFLPLDLLVSATGLGALWRRRRFPQQARGLTLISLSLTSASGLMAISFWCIERDFEPAWWLPNLFLLLYPLPFLRALLATAPAPAHAK